MAAPAGIAPSRTILVVDDEPMVRLVVSRLLQDWDFKVVEADNGRSALQLAQKLSGTLSMVITDLCMPHMDGCEFANAFRPLYPNVPILFMTGQGSNAVLGDLWMGGEHLLFKPFGPDSFLDTVARLLESRINEGRTSA